MVLLGARADLPGSGGVFLRIGQGKSAQAKVLVCALASVLLLSILGLADPIRFRWALRVVDGAIVVSGLACLAWRSLWKAGPFFWGLSIPAVKYLLSGRSGTMLDVIVAPDGSPPTETGHPDRGRARRRSDDAG